MLVSGIQNSIEQSIAGKAPCAASSPTTVAHSSGSAFQVQRTVINQTWSVVTCALASTLLGRYAYKFVSVDPWGNIGQSDDACLPGS